MKKKSISKLFSLITAFLMLPFFITSCEKEPAAEPVVKITNTPTENVATAKEFHTTIKSAIAADNFEYTIDIYLPAIYETNKNLPTIYITDGKWNYQLAKDNNFEAVAIAISGNEDRRAKDFSPTSCTENCSNVAFYKFIAEELIPYIDEKYETDQDHRTLFGHSFGGAFILSSIFFQDPLKPFFTGFVASEPVGLINLERLMHDNKFPESSNPFWLYVSFSKVGINDGDVKRLADLNFEQYDWLDITVKEFPDKDHESVVAPTFQAGIKSILEKFKE